MIECCDEGKDHGLGIVLYRCYRAHFASNFTSLGAVVLEMDWRHALMSIVDDLLRRF
jgi:hypothetical protein